MSRMAINALLNGDSNGLEHQRQQQPEQRATSPMEFLQGASDRQQQSPIILAPHLRAKVPAAVPPPISSLATLVRSPSHDHRLLDPPQDAASSPAKRQRVPPAGDYQSHRHYNHHHQQHQDQQQHYPTGSVSPYRSPQHSHRLPSPLHGTPPRVDHHTNKPVSPLTPMRELHSPVIAQLSPSLQRSNNTQDYFRVPSQYSSTAEFQAADTLAKIDPDRDPARQHRQHQHSPKLASDSSSMQVDHPASSFVPTTRPDDVQMSVPSDWPTESSESRVFRDHASLSDNHLPPPSVDPQVQSPVIPQAQDDPDLQTMSMPPPAKTKKQTGPRKKPGPKPKVVATNSDGTPKPRKKPGPKPKARNPDGSIIRDPNAPSASSKTKASKQHQHQQQEQQQQAFTASNSRSRSTSVMPPRHTPSVGPEGDSGVPDVPEDTKENDATIDKLYCICQTLYDGERIMIACDSCDEWFHTSCVQIPDFGVELVDQFFCPDCISKNPSSNLRTTYKQRCLAGLAHPSNQSPEACHKAARGAFSKYCSERCGVQHMRTKIQNWESKGGKRENLWKMVRHAEKPEGVVVRVVGTGTKTSEADDGSFKTEVDGEVLLPEKSRVARETERLKGLLEHVVKLREDMTKSMGPLIWREQLLELATARAEESGLCGWDQRLCFGDEEVAEFGEAVLESYTSSPGGVNGEDAMQVDGQGEWWCPGDKVCDRHAGWQTIRRNDIEKEKEQKEEGLAKLTTREREIRKRMEDVVEGALEPLEPVSSASKSKHTNGDVATATVAGTSSGSLSKKSRKRKTPTQ